MDGSARCLFAYLFPKLVCASQPLLGTGRAKVQSGALTEKGLRVARKGFAAEAHDDGGSGAKLGRDVDHRAGLPLRCLRLIPQPGDVVEMALQDRQHFRRQRLQPLVVSCAGDPLWRPKSFPRHCSTQGA